MVRTGTGRDFESRPVLCESLPSRLAAMEAVTYERVGAAAVLTIDRPQRRNAVDGPTADLLAEGYERFEADHDARVLILTGAGGVAFCAGADLKAIDTLGPRLTASGGPPGSPRGHRHAVRTGSRPRGPQRAGAPRDRTAGGGAVRGRRRPRRRGRRRLNRLSTESKSGARSFDSGP